MCRGDSTDSSDRHASVCGGRGGRGGHGGIGGGTGGVTGPGGVHRLGAGRFQVAGLEVVCGPFHADRKQLLLAVSLYMRRWQSHGSHAQLAAFIGGRSRAEDPTSPG